MLAAALLAVANRKAQSSDRLLEIRNKKANGSGYSEPLAVLTIIVSRIAEGAENRPRVRIEVSAPTQLLVAGRTGTIRCRHRSDPNEPFLPRLR